MAGLPALRQRDCATEAGGCPRKSSSTHSMSILSQAIEWRTTNGGGTLARPSTRPRCRGRSPPAFPPCCRMWSLQPAPLGTRHVGSRSPYNQHHAEPPAGRVEARRATARSSKRPRPAVALRRLPHRALRDVAPSRLRSGRGLLHGCCTLDEICASRRHEAGHDGSPCAQTWFRTPALVSFRRNRHYRWEDRGERSEGFERVT